jgi:putative endonuclease
MRQYYVYILASHARCLYIGVTNDLVRRVFQHKQGAARTFTRAYRIDRLVYFETTANVAGAIEREKQIKRWPRARKFRLIASSNPEWRDLSVDWYEGLPAGQAKRYVQ